MFGKIRKHAIQFQIVLCITRSIICDIIQSRRRSNVFGDASFWFCPNPNKVAQIWSLLPNFRFNFAQI